MQKDDMPKDASELCADQSGNLIAANVAALEKNTQNEEVAPDCLNGACAINWKPSRTAAA